ncbi:MAG TPA: hypothetical protein VG692_18545 [Gemmatimonadales bacterium]|nr:hypothetical protein [Gemmatimonadales bacterium]
MSYHLRFLVTDPGPLDLDDLVTSLRAANRKYRLEVREGSGTLRLGTEVVGDIQLITQDDEAFEDQLAELEEAASEGSGRGEARVADALATVQTIFAVAVSGQVQGRESLESLDPVWEWLFDSREGLLQADGEGYYDEEGLIFEVP